MSWFLRAGLVLCISLSSLHAQPADTGPFGQLAEKLGATAAGRNIVLPLRVFIRPTGAANQAVALHQAQDLAGSLAALSGHFDVLERSAQAMKDGIREQHYNMSEMVDKGTAVQIGNAKGAQAIVYLRTRPVGLQEELTAWLYVIETGQHLPNVSVRRSINRSAGFGTVRSLVLPGWGQWACGKKGAGSAFFLATVATAVGGFYANGQANSAGDDAVRATTATDRDRLVKDADDWQSKRNVFYAAAGALWVTNVLHASWISARTPITAGLDHRGQPSLFITKRF